MAIDDLIGAMNSEQPDYATGLTLAFDSNPDEEANKQRLERKTGIPSLLMDDTVRKRAELQQFVTSPAVQLLPSHAPKTAGWLANGENAKISHDDIEELSAIETVISKFRNGAGSLAAVPWSTSQGLWSAPRIAGDLLQTITKPLSEMTGLPDVGGKLAQYSTEQQKGAGETAKYLRGKRDNIGVVESGIYSGIESLGQNLLMLPATIMSGSPTPMLAGMTATQAGQSYGEARDTGHSVLASSLFGASQGAIEYATEMIPALRFVDAMKGKTTLAKALKNVLGPDVLGEQGATVMQDLNEWAVLNPEKPFSSYLEERPSAAAQTLIATIIGTGGMVATAKGLQKIGSSVDKYQAAKEQSDFIIALGDSVKASKTFARLPEKVQELVKSIKQDGAVQDLYVPVERFTELFQSQGMDPRQAAEQILSDPKRYYEAVATGGDVAIPLEEFARLADAPFYGELAKDAKTSITGMTAREREAFGQDQEQTVNDLLAELADEPAVEDVNYQDAQQRIYDDFYGQLLGKMSPTETADNSTLAAKMIVGLAKANGVTPELIMSQFPINVTRGDLPAALQRQPSFTEQQQTAKLVAMIDTIRSGKEVAPSDMFGPSLGELLREKGINDDRGDLASMDIDKGLKFKKKMLRKDGISLDRARELAVERKYLPEDATTNDLLEAIDSELRGQPKYSPEFANYEIQDKQRSLEELSQWLDAMGLDLNQMPNDQVLEMMQRSVNGGTELNQPLPEKITIDGADRWTVNSNGQPLAQTEEGIRNFWAWFGESKVVDEDGAPLVVYHGTGENFAEFNVPNDAEFDSSFPGSAQLGSFFSSHRVAKQFTGYGNQNIIPVYLKIENPYEISAARFQEMQFGEQERSDHLEGLAEEFEDETDGSYKIFGNDGDYPTVLDNETGKELTDDDAYELDISDRSKEIIKEYSKILNEDWREARWGATSEQWGELKKEAKDDDNDGFYVDSSEGHDFGEKDEHIDDTWIVFSPTQIKSVFNSGAYDPQNPNILFQSRGSAEGHEALSVGKTQAEGMLLTAVMQGGVVKVAGVGATHYDVHQVIKATAGEGITDANGFVTPDNKFLDRKQALVWLKENRPDVYKQLDKVTKSNGLESQDYAHAEGVTTDTDKLINSFMARTFGTSPQMLFQSAFHGSPHTFDKFTTEKIGTGEGMQAYGHGLYFAGKKEVAEFYREKLSNSSNDAIYTVNGEKLDNDTPERHGAALLYHNDAREIKALTKRWLKEYPGDLGMADTARLAGVENSEYWTRLNNFVQSHSKRDIKAKFGKLYHVELAPSENEMLSWNKPLSDQSKEVKELLKTSGILKDYNDNLSNFASPSETRNPSKKRGDSIYQFLSWKMGGDKQASEYLHSVGIRGIQYQADLIAKRGFEKSTNYVIFHEDDVTITKMEQKQKDVKRGYIKFGDSVPGFEIGLLKDADASTFIHELGHYYHEVLGRLAGQEDAPEQLKADYQTILGWLGATDKQSLTVEQSEKFARGFEAYLYEGNAPSQELRGVFQRFKTWLKAVYTSLKSLNVELTDDVRGVFDRLLATDDEIKAAEGEQNIKPMFASREDVGTSEAVFGAYVKLAEQAHEEAKDRLERAKLKEVKRTHQAWWKEARQKMAEEVEAEAKQEPVYEVLNFLYTGKLFDGSPYEGESFKLSGPELVKMYDAATVKAMRKRLGDVYRNEGGLSPHVVAEMFGFSSADEMVKKMMESPKLKEFVKAETDRRMNENYGAMNTAEIAEEAINAVHNDDQAKLLREELKAIWRKAKEVKPFVNAAVNKTQDRADAEREYERRWMDAERKLAVAIERGAKQAEIDDLKSSIKADKERARAAKKMAAESIPPVEFFKEAARRHIDGLKVSEILPGRFGQAEAKAGREAYDLHGKGKFAEAAQAKQRQILNHYLYREAMAAKEEAEKVREFFAKMEGKRAQGILGKAGQEFQDSMNVLLEQYEFRRVTNKELEYRDYLPGLIKRMKENGRDTAPLEDIVLIQKVNYRTLTLGELRDVEDVARFIYHSAKTAETIALGEKAINKGLIREEVVNTIMANGKQSFATMESKHGIKKWMQYGKDFITSSFNADTILFGLDGWERMGPAYQHIKGVIDDAVTKNLHPMQAKNGEEIEKLYSVYTGNELKKIFSHRFYVPEMQGSFTKEEILVLALNQGNEENRLAVVDSDVAQGIGLTQETVNAVLSRHMDQRDWEFVQSVLNYVSSYWPQIAEKQRQRTGITPKKVDASPMMTRFGIMAGGYFPLKADNSKSVSAGQDSAEEFFTSVRNGRFSWAQTAHGHTKERVGFGGRPVLLSLSVLHTHLNQVITDLAMGDAVNYSASVLNDAVIKQAFERTGTVDARKYLDVWLTDTAMGEKVAGDVISRTFRRLRTGIAAKSMLFNVGVGLLQISGIVQTAGVIGIDNTAYGVKQLLAKPWKGDNSVVKQIYALSPFMAKRDDTFQKDMMDLVSSIKSSRARNFLSTYGMWMIKRFQRIVDLATWLGAYHDGQARFKDEGNSEERARAYADRMVARAQGSGIFSDRSALERGSLGQDVRQNEFVRGLTTLLSYQIAKFNVAREKVGKTDFKDVGDVAGLAVDMALLYVVDSMLVMLMTGVWPGGDDDESWLWKLGKKTASSALSGVAGMRDITAFLEGFNGGGVIGTFGDSINRVYKQVEQREFDKSLIKAVNNLGGMLFKYPSSAMNRFGDALSRQLDGEDVSAVEYFIYQEKKK